MPTCRIVFAGTPDFVLPVLEAARSSRHELAAVYTRPDRPSGRGRKLRPGPVRQYAERHGLALEQPAVFDAEADRRLADHRPDLLLTMGYGLLLPAPTLALPALACVNVHTSLLPRWRGAAPVARAIEAGDAQSGVSLMRMTEQLDAGPVISRRPCAIDGDDTAAALSRKLGELGAGMVVEFLEQLSADAAQALAAGPQPSDGVCYAAKLQKREAWIDWRDSAAAIARKVRALNPWPVAQGRLGEQVLRIWRAEVCAGGGAPGQVVEASPAPVVACGRGALRLLSVQLPGGKPVSGAAFANGHRVAGRHFEPQPADSAAD